MALMPLNLFVTHNGRSSRQHVTCRYKCGDACSKPAPNTSDNEYFGDIAKALSRRSVLQAGGIAVLAVGAGSALATCGRDAQPAATPTSSAAPAEAPPGMKFTAITPNSEDAVVIPEGYKQAVVISWGDPVLPTAPRFDVKAQTGAAQRGQFGFNNDYAGLLPIEGQPTVAFKPGMGVVVPPNTPHAGGKNGDKKTHIVSTYIVEKGKPLASPA